MKVGRPKADIDLTVVEEMASIGATLDEMAGVLRVGKSTIKDRAAIDPALAEAIECGRARGKATLRRAQWRAAIEDHNATMLIWLGKQMLGQRDMNRVEMSGPDGGPVALVQLVEQLCKLTEDQIAAMPVEALRAAVALLDRAAEGEKS